jgi:hypothetical protein
MEKKEKVVVRVGVVDDDFKELAPTNAGKAGRMLRRHKAVVYRRYPFTIKLKKTVTLDGSGTGTD